MVTAMLGKKKLKHGLSNHKTTPAAFKAKFLKSIDLFKDLNVMNHVLRLKLVTKSNWKNTLRKSKSRRFFRGYARNHVI
jgi:hypothetical protein